MWRAETGRRRFARCVQKLGLTVHGLPDDGRLSLLERLISVTQATVVALPRPPKVAAILDVDVRLLPVNADEAAILPVQSSVAEVL